MQEVVKIWIYIFLSKMVGKIKIFKNMHGDTMNNSDELTHKKMKFPSYCRTPEDNQMVSSWLEFFSGLIW